MREIRWLAKLRAMLLRHLRLVLERLDLVVDLARARARPAACSGNNWSASNTAICAAAGAMRQANDRARGGGQPGDAERSSSRIMVITPSCVGGWKLVEQGGGPAETAAPEEAGGKSVGHARRGSASMRFWMAGSEAPQRPARPVRVPARTAGCRARTADNNRRLGVGQAISSIWRVVQPEPLVDGARPAARCARSLGRKMRCGQLSMIAGAMLLRRYRRGTGSRRRPPHSSCAASSAIRGCARRTSDCRGTARLHRGSAVSAVRRTALPADGTDKSAPARAAPGWPIKLSVSKQ